MAFYQDLKKFLSRGNVIDMSVGIILGASFTKIVDTLVHHVLMPPLGFLVGGVDFSRFKLTLKEASEASPAVTIELGLFIGALLNFFVVGFSVFILVKVLSRLHRKAMLFAQKACPECKMEIPIDALRCGHCTAVLKE